MREWIAIKSKNIYNKWKSVNNEMNATYSARRLVGKFLMHQKMEFIEGPVHKPQWEELK